MLMNQGSGRNITNIFPYDSFSILRVTTGRTYIQRDMEGFVSFLASAGGTQFDSMVLGAVVLQLSCGAGQGKPSDPAANAEKDTPDEVAPENEEERTVNEHVSALLGNMPVAQNRDQVTKRFKRRSTMDKLGAMITAENIQDTRAFQEKTKYLEVVAKKTRQRRETVWTFWTKYCSQVYNTITEEEVYNLKSTADDLKTFIGMFFRSTVPKRMWFHEKNLDNANDDDDSDNEMGGDLVFNAEGDETNVKEYCFRTLKQFLTDLSGRLARYLAVASLLMSTGQRPSSVMLAQGYSSRRSDVDPDEFLRRLEAGEFENVDEAQKQYDKAIGGRTMIEGDFEAKWAIPAFDDEILTPGIFAFAWQAVKGVFRHDWRDILNSNHANSGNFEYRLDAKEKPFLPKFTSGTEIADEQEVAASTPNRIHKTVFAECGYNAGNITMKSSRKAFAEAAKAAMGNAAGRELLLHQPGSFVMEKHYVSANFTHINTAALLSGDKENIKQKKVNVLQTTRLPPGRRSKIDSATFAKIMDADDDVTELKNRLLQATSEQEKKKLTLELKNAERSLRAQATSNYRSVLHKPVAGRQPFGDRTNNNAGQLAAENDRTGLTLDSMTPKEAVDKDQRQSMMFYLLPLIIVL
ncbi:hypothetical protein HDU96_006474 [Phlyctochytrium bullatum]|nr:hypothetical protein HDU96_006474 [Phlyctochytrium bullatum]